MKVNELMLGDWVDFYHPYEPEKKIVTRHRVTEIFECGLVGISNHPNPVHADHIEPVKITPEILEKNGFEDIGDDTYQLEEKPCWFWVDFFKHTYGCEYDTSTHEYEDDEHRLKLYGIPSVHELQHALRLCGIEKEIIL